MSQVGKRNLALIREQRKLRRQAIYVQYLSGVDARQLAEKYKVSRAQIYTLIAQAEKDQASSV